jgi:hypothetical protein
MDMVRFAYLFRDWPGSLFPFNGDAGVGGGASTC